MTKESVQEESGKSIGSSLFSTQSNGNNEEEKDMQNFAEQFKDKVRAIHEHFDKNQDGFLNFEELGNLQMCTSGVELDGAVYGHLCRGFGCTTEKGLSLDGLKLTYASEGTNLDEDYEKVFGETNNVDEANEEVQEISSVKLKIHDKVKEIHAHFDANNDGYLNYEELSKLQACTCEVPLDEDVYESLCAQFNCEKDEGLSLEGLNLTYATEVANLDEDYEKIFGKMNDNDNEENLNNVDTKNNDNSDADDEEEIFEIGDSGWVDVSPDS